MAEIPVEKKAGVPWWVWLLGALLLLGLLWWLLGSNDREATETAAVAPVETPVAMEPLPGTIAPAADTGPITDLAMITGAADPAALTGRQVQLTGVPVPEVPGDRTFLVGEGANRLFVFLPEDAPGLPTEDSVNVNPGQRVNLSGTLQPAQTTMNGRPVEGLPAGTTTMLVADRVDVVAR